MSNSVATDWHGCYRDGWGGIIVPDAFTHPAKFSRSLIARIYDHMREQGWLKAGDRVLDPFAGVGLGALDCMRIGCHWLGVELEPKFVALAERNIASWYARFSAVDGWRFGSPKIIHGDSRRLVEILHEQVTACVGSPPYSHRTTEPPSSRARALREAMGHDPNCISWSHDNYGFNPSNLGNLPERGFEAAVGSPPFSGTHSSPGNDPQPRAGDVRKYVRKHYHEAYGICSGQLAAMPEGQFEGVVSSPPYQTGGHHKHQMDSWNVNAGGHGIRRERSGYGEHADQLQGQGDTFWSVARQILEQVYLYTKPGGHAVWVVKAFVRKGKRVDFPGQWRQLCEAVGFRCLHVHRAWLVEEKGAQQRIDGGETRLMKERKSFFRRLAEKKGSPRVDFEEVQCYERR